MNQFLQKNTLLLFILVISLGIIGFLQVQQELSLNKNTKLNDKSPHQINRFKIIEYNDNGKIKQVLKANSVVQNGANRILLSSPQVKRHLASGKINEIKADSGIYFPNDNTFHFQKNVIINELTKKGRNIISSMKTNSLSYNTKTELATTNDWVKITKQTLDIEAQGIISNLKKETLSFPGKTKVRYKKLI